MKWRELEIGHCMNGPAITPVRMDVLSSHCFPFTITGQEGSNIQALFLAFGRSFQRSDHLTQGSAGSSTHSGILLVEQRLGLDRPWHEFAVQAKPITLKLLPEIRALQGRAYPRKQLCLKGCIVKELPAGAGVADANAFPRNAEVLTRGMFIPAHDHYRPRTHMFLLTDDAGHPFVTIVVNDLKVRRKMSVGRSCVEPSGQIFGGRRFDTISILWLISEEQTL